MTGYDAMKNILLATNLDNIGVRYDRQDSGMIKTNQNGHTMGYHGFQNEQYDLCLSENGNTLNCHSV